MSGFFFYFFFLKGKSQWHLMKGLLGLVQVWKNTKEDRKGDQFRAENNPHCGPESSLKSLIFNDTSR